MKAMRTLVEGLFLFDNPVWISLNLPVLLIVSDL
jgi:hypothetical protein